MSETETEAKPKIKGPSASLEEFFDKNWEFFASTLGNEQGLAHIIAEHPDGGIDVFALLWQSEEEKDAITAKVSAHLQAGDYIRYAFGSEAWIAGEEDYSPEDLAQISRGNYPAVKPSQCPNRKEVLIAIGVERADRRAITAHAEILNLDDGRKLGERTPFGENGEGRFAELFGPKFYWEGTA